MTTFIFGKDRDVIIPFFKNVFIFECELLQSSMNASSNKTSSTIFLMYVKDVRD